MLAKQGTKGQNKVLQYLSAAGKGAKNAAAGRVYDPNFYAIDFLQNLIRPKE